jgi:N-acetylmuramoyl-L-alanine amidase
MSLIRRNVLEGVQRLLVAALAIVALAIVTLSAHAFWTWNRQDQLTAQTLTPPPLVQDPAIPTAAPAVLTPAGNSLTPTVADASATSTRSNKIGIVAGHWQSDSGAVCDDGLTEAEINLAVAQRVVSLLSRAGYDAEILAEFSPQLEGYQGLVLVSIHTDSCSVPEATGFKVARVSSSVVPDIEDRLVACMIEKYGEATGLQFHRNSITFDMTEYHAFYEIAPETPAAIIEIGFMAADRHLLTKRQDRIAQGIVNGIKCFVASTQPQ